MPGCRGKMMRLEAQLRSFHASVPSTELKFHILTLVSYFHRIQKPINQLMLLQGRKAKGKLNRKKIIFFRNIPITICTD
jgi:hypothetical protein